MPTTTRRRIIRLSTQALAYIGSLGLLNACQKKPFRSIAQQAENLTPPSPGSPPNRPQSGAPKAERAKPLSWEEFVNQIGSLAALQYTDKWHPEEHVGAVSHLLQQLNLENQVLVDALSSYVNSNANFPQIKNVHEAIAFEISVIQFAPGEQIKLHNHPDMTGVIYCINGDINIEGYNLLEETSSDGNLLIQKVADTRLRTGELATLTPLRSNIHALKANSFTVLLDVFTPPYSAGNRLSAYRWYAKHSLPVAHSTDIYEAWET